MILQTFKKPEDLRRHFIGGSDDLHRYGDEASWWAGVNVDPVPIALALWRRTRPDAAPDIGGGGSQPQAATSADIAATDQAMPPKMQQEMKLAKSKAKTEKKASQKPRRKK